MIYISVYNVHVFMIFNSVILFNYWNIDIMLWWDEGYYLVEGTVQNIHNSHRQCLWSDICSKYVFKWREEEVNSTISM